MATRIEVGPKGPSFDRPPDAIGELGQDIYNWAFAVHRTLAGSGGTQDSVAERLDALVATLTEKGILP